MSTRSLSSGNTADAAVGMMDGAYFTSRKDILDFFNDLLALNLTKIEQTASGAVACQIVEYIFPGSIPLRRVNWEAKTEYEYVQNYKLLQAAFTKQRVQRHVDVDRLIRGKYQDNLEFCQWLKAFYDQAGPSVRREDYDPVAARSRGKGGKGATQRFKQTARQHGSKFLPGDRPTAAAAAAQPRGGAAARARPTGRPAGTGGKTSGGAVRVPVIQKENAPNNSGNVSRGAAGSAAPPPRRKVSRNETAATTTTSSEQSIVADATLLKKNADLSRRNAELELTVSNLERERDFYFEKLRDVEVMLQVHQEKKRNGGGECGGADPEAVLDRVFKVLYATSDQDLSVDFETGELVVSGGGDGGDADVAEEGSPSSLDGGVVGDAATDDGGAAVRDVDDHPMEAVDASADYGNDDYEDDDEDLLAD